jgi:uracil permease
MFSTLFGGCPNTTYGESIGCVAITRNASTISIWGCAVLCIVVSLISPLVALLETIPHCVMGGVCIALYGFIAVSGLKMVQKTDLGDNRNLFVVSVILIAGVGGMALGIPIGNDRAIKLTSIAVALIIGIVTNLILSAKKDGKKEAEAEKEETETK